MLKFRSLTPTELTELETEFKQFLILNELYDAEWRKLASEDPQKAQGFIDLFSNIVLEKVYNNLPGLVHIGENFISVFELHTDPWQLYHFQLKDKAKFALATSENFLKIIQNNWSELAMHKGSKKSSEHKSTEVYQLLCKGATPLHKDDIQEFLKFMKNA
ncbi:MAG: hypothetical protein RLZZ211_270 [Bacteroidota bacterium]|jgi:hypothetical protein